MLSQTKITGTTVVVLVVALSMVATPAVAETQQQPDWVDETFADSSTMVSTYNENVDADALGTAGGQLAGETINLDVTAADGSTATFSFEMTEDLRIENLDRGPREDATMEMHTERSTFEAIAHAPNPERKFRTAVEQGDVEIGGVGVVNSAKWGVLNGVAEFARSLGLF